MVGLVTTAVFLSSVAALAGSEEAASSGEAADAMDSLGSVLDFINVPTVTAARREQSQDDAPARLVVIDQATISHRGYLTLPDLLKDLPGYQVTELSSPETGSYLRVRGLGGNHRVVFLIDGRRYNPPGGEEVPLWPNMSLFDVDHVEVMYGPGSALYGNDAFNGIINIISRRAKPDAVTSRARLVYGAHNSLDGAAEILGSTGDFHYEASAHVARRGYDDFYSLYPQEYLASVSGLQIPSQQLSVNGSTAGPFTADDLGYDVRLHLGIKEFSLQYIRRQYDRSSSWDDNASGVPFVRLGRFADEQDIILAEYTHRQGDYELTVYSDFSRYSTQPQTRRLVLSDPTIQSYSLDGYEVAQSYAFRFEPKFSYALFDSALNLTLGGLFQNIVAVPQADLTSPLTLGRSLDDQARQFNYILYQGTGDAPPTDENGVVQTAATIASQFTGNHNLSSLNTVTFRTYGAYAQAQWSRYAWMQLTGALRIDYSERYGNSVNPRLGLVSRITPSTTIKLIYGRAYLEPTPLEQYGTLVTRAGFEVPNESIHPESMQSWEVAAAQNLGRWGRLSASGFLNVVSDLINDNIWDLTYIYMLNGANQLVQYPRLRSINNGEARFYGADLMAQFQLPYVGFDVDASYFDGTVDRLGPRGTQLVGQIPVGSAIFMLKAGAYTEPLPGLGINVRARFYSAPRLGFSSTDFPQSDLGSAAFLLDANVRYKVVEFLQHSLAIFVRGTNLTNTKYKLGSSDPDINPIGTPQAPLQILAGLECSQD